MAELDNAIDWALSRDPSRFYSPLPGYYLWKMEQMTADVPSLLLLYRYDPAEDVVYLINVC